MVEALKRLFLQGLQNMVYVSQVMLEGRISPYNCVYKIARQHLNKEVCIGTIITKLPPFATTCHQQYEWPK